MPAGVCQTRLKMRLLSRLLSAARRLSGNVRKIIHAVVNRAAKFGWWDTDVVVSVSMRRVAARDTDELDNPVQISNF
jgi:hypothetical protein